MTDHCGALFLSASAGLGDRVGRLQPEPSGPASMREHNDADPLGPSLQRPRQPRVCDSRRRAGGMRSGLEVAVLDYREDRVDLAPRVGHSAKDCVLETWHSESGMV